MILVLATRDGHEPRIGIRLLKPQRALSWLAQLENSQTKQTRVELQFGRLQ